MQNNPILIVGAGPAGLMAAQELAKQGHQVHLYEKNKAAGRKFLVAGHGGFNLTHSESINDFVKNYDQPIIQKIVRAFDNQQTIQWLEHIGISTYVGSSGKVFPTKNTKPIQVLQAWLLYLQKLGVHIHYEHSLMDFSDSTAILMHQGRQIKKNFSHLILALGGSSWQKTGSDGKWMELFKRKNIPIKPFKAANSGLNTLIDFSELEGKLLKNCRVSYGNHSKLGELVFTKYGLEGSPIYYLNRFIRYDSFPLKLELDFKPSMTQEKIQQHLIAGTKISCVLKEKLHLSSTAILLLKKLDKQTYTNAKLLSKNIKQYAVEVNSFRPIDEVISTAGGVCFSSLQDDLSLNLKSKIYCIGEMLDWDAPTGGYLLQACFSTGVWVANSINRQQ